MTQTNFLKLELEEKHLYLRQNGLELASCITSFGKFQNYVFYEVDNFFVEEIYDMKLLCLSEINIITEKEVYQKYIDISLL
ncbi:MAG: hypothetical protein COW66_13195 [Flavobacteriaceae bacterium CG18_big_fil_WC_8_21_14_2_50_34_36]|nr:hypothetical protein [Flavobacteriia bacterium]PIQ17166.1 MAG: hypothetical protein COW66_13195 [Flavobacteriaceae bacterium CG18_big_fil_WC_8_21_14_2_50_34_36]